MFKPAVIYANIKRIKLWQWIFAIGISFSSILSYLLSFSGNPGIGYISDYNIWEAMIKFVITNNQLLLVAGMVILTSKLGVMRVDDITRGIRMKNRNNLVTTNILSILTVTLIYLVLYIAVYTLIGIFGYKYNINNVWSDMSLNSQGSYSFPRFITENFTPFTALLQSVFFEYFYIVFFCIFILALNILFQYPVGGVLITFPLVFENFILDYNGFLLPVSHARIELIYAVKNGAVISILYWIFLISILISLCYIFMAKADLVVRSVEGET